MRISARTERGQSTLAVLGAILVADLVMSLENVIALALAERNDLGLLAARLLIRIPMVIFASAVMIRLLKRLPAVVILADALMGRVGGHAISPDEAVFAHVEDNFNLAHNLKVRDVHCPL